MTTPTSAGQAVLDIAEDVWRFRLERDAFLQLRSGVPVTRLSGVSLADVEESAAFARTTLRRLDAVSGPLAGEDQVTVDVLRYSSRLAIDAVDNHWYGSPVTPYASHLLTFYADRVFGNFDFTTDGAPERYLHLLAELAALLRDIGAKVQGQRDRGILLPKPALPGAVGSLLAQRAMVGARLRPAVERLGESGRIGLQQKIEALVDDEVLVAFDDVLELLDDDYAERAPETVGMSQYPGGADYYRYAIRLYNTLDVDPQEVHTSGLEQVAALTEQMSALRGALGSSESEKEFHERLAKEPSLFASSPQEVEAKYLRAMERLEPLIGDYFSVLPKAAYGVKRLDPALEPGMTYGMYEPPTPDEPVGYYRYNGSDLESRSLLNATAIVYHELAPGHHFHIARQSENETLPRIRREAIEFGAFNEGWAEYAASLADEMGLYDEGYDRYGLLSHQRFIAQRLVVDTGLNALGWNLDRARDYMRANTLESEVQIASETIRYSTGLPAQALGYRLGFLKFHELRDRATSALGAGFDIREFHEWILGSGALPLEVLERHVDNEIDRRRRETASA